MPPKTAIIIGAGPAGAPGCFVVMRREGNIDPQVRAIVQEAGLSNQAFYRHFASKDALLLAVLAVMLTLDPGAVDQVELSGLT